MLSWLLVTLAFAAPTRIGAGPIPADGGTASEVRIWLEPGARKTRVTVDEGDVSSMALPGDGTAVVRLVPPLRSTPGTLALFVTSDRVTTRIDVPVVPVIAPPPTAGGPTTVLAGEPVVIRFAAAGTTTPPRVDAGALTVRDLAAEGPFWRVELGGVTEGAFVVSADIAGERVAHRFTAVAGGPWIVTASPDPIPAKGRGTTAITARGPAAPAWSWVAGTGGSARASSGAWTSTATLADGVAAVAVDVGPKVAPSGAPAAAIAGQPESPVVHARTGVLARFAVVDAGGLPVADTDVTFTRVSGDGVLSAAVGRTDALGLARVTITAGERPGPITVRADAGPIWTELAVLTVTSTGGPDVYPDPSGPAARWLATVTPATFYREGMAVVHPPVTAAASAEPVAAASDPAAPRQERASAGGTADPGPVFALVASDALGIASFDGEGTTFPADARYGTALPGSLALTADLVVPVVADLSALGVVTGRLEGWAADGDRGISPQLDLRAGGRWDLGALDAGLTVARVSGLPLRYTPSGASEGFTAARAAIRPEIGLAFPVGSLAMRAGVGVALGPEPLEETFELTTDLGDDDGFRPRLGLALEHRGWTVERGILSGKLSQTRLVLAAGGVFGG